MCVKVNIIYDDLTGNLFHWMVKRNKTKKSKEICTKQNINFIEMLKNSKRVIMILHSWKVQSLKILIKITDMTNSLT